MQKRRIVLTAALPYANGPIHFGHLVEYSIPDFWARFQKMRGHECLYICADDTHGTPIMLRAKQEGITPEELIQRFHAEHLKDFNGFDIKFDHFGSTHDQANRQYANDFFAQMVRGKHLVTKTLEQSYCEHDKMFLPDRFVKGTCPKCNSQDQYGDSCDVCSATYQPKDLRNPQCTLCKNPPVTKTTDHLFFRLGEFKSFLSEWVPKHTSSEVYNKLKEWLDGDLQDWCISRDAPYFGFEIPDHPGKYFYVWLDAPIGYLSSTAAWCLKNSKDIKDYWSDKSEIYHSIGKDIIYFHALFWPAMLKCAGWATPDNLFVHGMLTVNGVKMSKSKGTFIDAATYLRHLDPVYLRYYFACKISSSIADFDLNLDDFVTRVNSDLIGKITNVASRGATMLSKLGGVMGHIDPVAHILIREAQELGDTIADHFENRDFARAMLAIRTIADEANKYFDDHEPWKLIKIDPDRTKMILTTILNQFRCMAIYLKPILPSYTAKVEALFNEPPYLWADSKKLLENHRINAYSHIVNRVDPAKVQAIIDDTKNQSAPTVARKDETPTIEYGDFAKLDLRIAKIVAAEDVPGADKLLRLSLDLGQGNKTVFAGIKTAYAAKDIVGRLTVVVANLAPKKLKFGLSEGMVLCAGSGGKDLFLLSPDSGAKPGDKVS